MIFQIKWKQNIETAAIWKSLWSGFFNNTDVTNVTKYLWVEETRSKVHGTPFTGVNKTAFRWDQKMICHSWGSCHTVAIESSNCFSCACFPPVMVEGGRWRWESWGVSTRFNFCFRRYNHLSPLGLQVQRLWFEGRGGVWSRGVGVGGWRVGEVEGTIRALVEEELLNSRQQPSSHGEPAFQSIHSELNATSANHLSCESAGFGKTNLRNHLPH